MLSFLSVDMSWQHVAQIAFFHIFYRLIVSSQNKLIDNHQYAVNLPLPVIRGHLFFLHFYCLTLYIIQLQLHSVLIILKLLHESQCPTSSSFDQRIESTQSLKY